MSLRSKAARIGHTLKMIAIRGGVRGTKTFLNRYRYDHTVASTLPIVSPTTPYHIQIEPARTCNLRCPMCRYTARDNPNTRLSLKNFKAILAQFPTAMSLDLTGLGEPFMNREFLDLVRYAKQRGFQVSFNTNGYLLSEDKMDALIEMGTDAVQFSIDAATEPTYDKIRVGSDFGRVMGAIETLNDKVARSKQGKPETYLTYTLNMANIDEAWRFPGLAKKVGALGVIYRDMISFPEVQYAQDNRVEALGEEALQKIASRVLSEARTHDIAVTLAPALAGERPERLLCSVPWKSAFVDVNGHFYPCCRWQERHDGDAAHAWGNLLTDDFLAIWNHDAYRKLREEIVHETAIPDQCVGCEELIKSSASLTGRETPRPIAEEK